jgi:peptide/nickel transport system permease protein
MSRELAIMKDDLLEVRPNAAQPPQGEKLPRVRIGFRPSAAVTILFGVLFVALLIACFLAQFLSLPDPNAQDVANSLKPPIWMDGGSSAHPLGTDQLGRDLLSRLLFGGRLTLLMTLGAVGIACLVGVTIGTLAGFFGGWQDSVLSRIIDAQLALPFILLALTLALAAGQSIYAITMILSLATWAQFARISRSEAITLRNSTFILSLRANGMKLHTVFLRHLVPNLLPTIMVVAALQFGVVILAESGLSYLSMGVLPPHVTWGTMLVGGQDYLRSAWWIVTLPGIFIVFTCLCFNVLSDWARDRFDPTVSKGRRS